MTPRCSFSLLPLVILLSGLVLAPLAPPARAQAVLQQFRILMPEPHGHTFRALYVGVEKGWFREAGLDIQFLTVPGGAVNLMPQLAQGGGELAFAGGYTVIQARARGIDVVGINSASTESLWSLITRSEANIGKPQDLKGKTLGVVSFASATHFMAMGALKAGGLTETEVNLRPIGMGGPAALSQAQIDGYVWFKTQGLALQVRGAKVDILSLDEMIPLPQDLVLTTGKLIKEKPELLRAYLRVLLQATLYNLDPANDAENDGYQAKYAPESVVDKVYLKALREFERGRNARDVAKGWRWGTTLPEPLAASQDYLAEIKVIDRKTPVADMFDNSFLPAASAQR